MLAPRVARERHARRAIDEAGAQVDHATQRLREAHEGRLRGLVAARAREQARQLVRERIDANF